MNPSNLEQEKSAFNNSFKELEKSQFSETQTKLEFESFISKQLGERKNLKVLEIGCGSTSHINLGKDPYIVGIDIAAEQLERNEILQEKIVANIEDYALPESEYDVIVSWWVLEHLARPDLVLKNCQQALKPDGALILVSPDPRALKGLITKFTPQWFHVLISRYIFGFSKAGVEEQGPFRTYLKESMSPSYIKKFSANNGLSVELFQEYENYWQEALRRRYWFANAAWSVATVVLESLSFGYINVKHSDYRFYIRKI